MSNSPPASPATLSLCLIVRNGVPALAEALASARSFMDEMVVVDTGSTDDSRQVAASFGARVVEFPWCDDFSAARNYSLEQATGDWIFWMDADDVLPEDSGRELRRLIRECPGKDATFWVNVEEDVPAKTGAQPRTMAHAHIKLFPRHPRIRFCYRIHEQVAPAIRALGLPIRRTQAVVRHVHAGRSRQAEQARAERNLRLVNLDLEERPDDPFVWLSVGTAYLFAPRGLPKAIDFLRRSIAGLKRGSATQLNAYLYLGQALGTSGDRQAEGQVYREALELFPDDAALLMRLGTACEHTGRLEEAATCYQAILQRGRLRSSVVHVSSGHVHAALRLGEIYARLGQRQRAERLWREFLKRHPEAAAVQAALTKSYLDPCSIIVGPAQ
jgi:Glycosyl transferase family 2/Tetratricopeptide repeat